MQKKMMNVSILKLGGSILTDKQAGKPIIRTHVVKHIIKDIMRTHSRQRDLPLILLYGGGSFGHPLARLYKLVHQPLTMNLFTGVGYTITAMRRLGTSLAELLLNAGIPVVPLQTSSFVKEEHGQFLFTDLSQIKIILAHGAIPLLGGDVIFSDHQRTMIASADILAVELARRFRSKKIFFATDTDGVYKRFPPLAGEHPIPFLDRRTLTEIISSHRVIKKSGDVTGAMQGKLKALLRLHNCTVAIFNGNTPGIIADTLGGIVKGTVIKL